MAYNTSSSIKKVVSSAIYRTFGWMSVGLTLTGIISYLIGTSPYVYSLFGRGGLGAGIWILFIAQIALVGIMSFGFQRLNSATLATLFLGYSALNGFTLSFIFVAYEFTSVVGVFFIAALMFAMSSLYGYLTEQDLSGMGYFLMMALWGLIAIGLVNLFFKSAFLDLFASFIGVIVFAGLTAFDIQKIKNIFKEMAYDEENISKISIYGALQMYLNYINLFLNLLRLLGKRKND
jgi:FtsH-binding integral membrane protein